MTSTPGKDSLSVEETEDLVKNVGAISFDGKGSDNISTDHTTHSLRFSTRSWC